MQCARSPFARTQLNYFGYTQVLILRNLGIRRIDNLQLPLLRYCDLAYNVITDPRDVHHMLYSSTALEALELTGNPICDQPHFPYSVIALCPSIWSMNGKPVETEQRYAPRPRARALCALRAALT